ncbi:efflux transporter, RND family, MFP subunit [Sphingobacterium spiritivorum ATCC 33300]|uniref:Efflux transporter, RND family, MFP subunit n=1 Tax=Sphingobacterium spiritivorum ATCC 33300 TaxID=525372 RepID=C2G4K0_SPHSI|nr:efflux RND transporter periplasmic adaptor subunit [Sphingobacterium spiritivorum]EEI89921.1 efflux transporter, RND family, MFP subunit [Sphingobacterium spiritivorum ATCC 33300]QQS94855.1 efflux RND transporter periplasmic adaptor subunit [Sphingobacterium spiritivorum]
MKRTIITIVIIVAALAGIMFILNKNKEKNKAETEIVAQQNAAVAVRIDTVAVREMNAQYISNGTFMPFKEMRLSAETPGRVKTVLVDEGDFVTAGQVLATVVGDKLNVNTQNAQASYNTSKADYERYKNAFQTGGVTQQQLDQAKLKMESDLNNLKSAQLNASDATVRAGISGTINERKIEPGTYVSPGTEMFSLVNVGTLKLRVNVDEKNVVKLKVGQNIKITASVYPDKSFEGKITFIAPKADGSLNFPVEIEVKNNPNNELRAGMYGTAVFGADQLIPVLTVPRTAFVGSVSSNQIFVNENNKAVLKTITSGRNFGDYVEVLDGLSAGQIVITSGQINLLNNTPISIIK